MVATKYPNITFTTSREEEAGLLCFNAKNIQLGYLQKANMFVLPYIVPRYAKSVYFPDWFDNEFWKMITKHKEIDYGHPYSEKLLTKTLSILEKHPHNDEFLERIEEKERNWKLIEPEYLNLCKKFLNLDETLDKIDKIEILYTPYGTAGSFYPLKTKNGYHIKMSARVDMPVSYFGRLLLLNFSKILTNSHAETGEVSWHERMAIIRFLTDHTVFSKFNKEDYFQCTVKVSKLARDSNDYLDKLGFSKKRILTLTKNGRIEINRKRTTNFFTPQEKRVIVKLINTRNKTVDYEDLATALWGNEWEDKFSLQAIAKVMENIRSKLMAHGAKHNLIQSVRGEGYALLD